MKLLVDSDAFCKLAIVGLLQPTANLFEADLNECGRLAALPYMLRKGRIRNVFGAGACDKLIPLVETMPVVERRSATWIEKLTPVEDIDPGEAQLFAAAAESNLIIVTGDKRSLRALKNVGDFVVALAGRIVVLEAILLTLCDRLGPDNVRQKISPLADWDAMIKVCFSGDLSDPSECLRSYYNSLVVEVEPLRLWDPHFGEKT